MTSWRDGSLAARWLPVLNTYEIAASIPYDLLARQCYEESHFNPAAVNPKSGAIGLMQLLPQDFPGAGKDPVKDIGIGGAYLKKLYGDFGKDWQLALAAYDFGPGNMRKWRQDGGTFATLPKETRDYVSQIIEDVPVEGALCKVQSPTSPLPGFLAAPSSAATPSVAPSPSLWSRLSSPFTPKASTTTVSPSPSVLSAPLLPVILSPIVKTEVSMSSPNPFQAAAAPALIAVLQALQAFLVNMGTDPLQLAVKFPGALQVFLGTVEMQLPAVATAELGAVQTAANAKIAALIAELQKPPA
jgi:hypothetical protein